MSTTTYPYGPGSYDLRQLDAELLAAGLPAPAYMNGSGYPAPGAPATHVDIAYEGRLLTDQKQLLDATVAAHVPEGPRRPRQLLAIRTDIEALSDTQRVNIWNDLTTLVGGAYKYLTDYGENDAAIMTLDWCIWHSRAPAADLRAAQTSLFAMYTQDNPTFLVAPPFDPSINVPGDEPVP